MMTAQEAMDKFGWVAWGSAIPLNPGDVRVEKTNDGMIPEGTKVVIVGKMTSAEMLAFARVTGAWSTWPLNYKVIAE